MTLNDYIALRGMCTFCEGGWMMEFAGEAALAEGGCLL